jgi:hypothetical protein
VTLLPTGTDGKRFSEHPREVKMLGGLKKEKHPLFWLCGFQKVVELAATQQLTM